MKDNEEGGKVEKGRQSSTVVVATRLDSLGSEMFNNFGTSSLRKGRKPWNCEEKEEDFEKF